MTGKELKDILTNAHIAFIERGDDFVMMCPFCKKAKDNTPIMLFHLNQKTCDGRCYYCQKEAKSKELLKEFGIDGEDTQEEKLEINISDFKEISVKELSDTLGLTIKQDDVNKVLTFLCELSAYTEDSQFNISFNAPSSAGKSYIPMQIADLFPKEDVIDLAYCSPTAFFHDIGEYDKDIKGYRIDFSRKIVIFLDQPHSDVLGRMRPLLSQDKKELTLKVTDKTEKHGLKTKTVIVKGFPSVIFCTAGLKIDEQESTRFLLLSPEINQEKLRAGIEESIKKAANSESYNSALENNPERKLLKKRISAIKNEYITDIRIKDSDAKKITEQFFKLNPQFKPRHQRDIKRIISIIKALALLNLWWREKEGSTITVNEADIQEGFRLWREISGSQDLNIPPYINDIYAKVIAPLWKHKEENDEELSITKREIFKKYFDAYGRNLENHKFGNEILPSLENAGLIVKETNPLDRRTVIFFPGPKINNINRGGVDLEEMPDGAL